jgi:hypothetical protein
VLNGHCVGSIIPRFRSKSAIGPDGTYFEDLGRRCERMKDLHGQAKGNLSADLLGQTSGKRPNCSGVHMRRILRQSGKRFACVLRTRGFLREGTTQ